MGVFGNLLGQGIGYLGGGLFGGQKAKDTGRTIGGALGGLLPFKQGGKVRGPMNIQGPMAEQVVKPMMMKKKKNKRKMKK